MQKRRDKRPAAAIAQKWGVTIRTVSKWRQQWGDADVDNEAALARRILATANTPDHVRQVARDIVGDEGEIVEETVPDIGKAALAAIGDLPALAEQTQKHLDRVNQKLVAADRLGDHRTIAAQTKLFRELTATLLHVRRTQAALGQDAGELIAKSEALRVVRAWASRACLGIQMVRDKLAPRLVGIETETEVAERLDDALIRQLLLSPFARAVNVAAPCGLPDWFVEEIKNAMGDNVASGEKEFEQAREEESK